MYKRLLFSSSICLSLTPYADSLIPRFGKRRAPISISEELGTSPAFNYKLFDPLDLANEETFASYRESELKHGRIAMLAVIGNVIPDLYREQIVPHMNLSNSYKISFQDVPCGLKALSTVPLFGWFQILAFIGFLETNVFVQKDIKDMPGDYSIGYFGLRDKARNERSLRSELENGRLAMIAFLGQVFAELSTGNAPMGQVKQVLDFFQPNSSL
jgi:hypothetical protein